MKNVLQDKIQKHVLICEEENCGAGYPSKRCETIIMQGI
jgi:hypothetical protein